MGIGAVRGASQNVGTERNGRTDCLLSTSFREPLQSAVQQVAEFCEGNFVLFIAIFWSSSHASAICSNSFTQKIWRKGILTLEVHAFFYCALGAEPQKQKKPLFSWVGAWWSKYIGLHCARSSKRNIWRMLIINIAVYTHVSRLHPYWSFNAST